VRRDERVELRLEVGRGERGRSARAPPRGLPDDERLRRDPPARGEGTDGERRADDGDGTTAVTYTLEVELNIGMLGMFKRKAEKMIMDTALKELKRRVESLARA